MDNINENQEMREMHVTSHWFIYSTSTSAHLVLLPQLKMADAISAKPSLSIPLLNSQRTPFHSQANLSFLRRRPFCQLNQSHSLTIQSINPNQSLHSSGIYLPRNFGVSCAAHNGEGGGGGGETKNDVDEAGRGESTMPERFRYLTKEAPDQPVRWPWLIGMFNFHFFRVLPFVNLAIFYFQMFIYI